METVSLKLEEDFLEQVEAAMKSHNYTTKAEFIREAIREKLIDLEKQGYIVRALKLFGASKRKTTDEELHRAREEAARELAKELGVE